MLRNDILPGEIYCYSAGWGTNMTRYPVLILDQTFKVFPNEVVSVTGWAGQGTGVAYERPRPTTAGLLGILSNAGSMEEKLACLERCKELDAHLVLELGQQILPEGALAVVVYPKNILAEWEQHLADEEAARLRSEEWEQQYSEWQAAREPAIEAIRKAVEDALAAHGVHLPSDNDELRRSAIDVKGPSDGTVTIPFAELSKLVEVKWPEVDPDLWA